MELKFSAVVIVPAGAQSRGTISRLRPRRRFARSRTRGGSAIATARAGKPAKIGRKRRNGRPAENGRADAARIAPVASQRPFRPGIATIGRNAKNAMLGASKSKSPHSTWTMEHGYTCPLSARESRAPRALHADASRLQRDEKHKRSLTLLTRSTCPRQGFSLPSRPTPGVDHRGRITRYIQP